MVCAPDPLVFLHRRAEIEPIKKKGRRFQTPLFNLVSCVSPLPRTGVGIVVSRRIGSAVCRNRAKRIFRELARHTRRQLVTGREFLVFPRRDALSARHPVLREAWITALRHEGLLISDPDRLCDTSASA